MRYSMLVYIVKMCRTLSEAAEYISTAPEDALRTELLENGKQMLAQIRSVLEQHKPDLRDPGLPDRLTELEAAWGSDGEDLPERLNEFAGELPKNVSYQVRAVFFAELGEKWDSMESVYEYMRDDPRFDPVVVRTPVGRAVNRSGKQEQEIIYKDFLTPMGIPSLGCDEYSIGDDCPELAFISQPYESCTPEQFWPETIAKHTRLVYLPYFLPSIVLEDYPQTLCRMRVYDVAWKVVGSNEKHYRYYCRYARNGGANMVVTGVPKIDPIVKLRSRIIPMPADWKCVQGKKTFLWNTWFDTNGSSYGCFESIFKWFSEHQDCALIWRPHPMTETILKLYKPKGMYEQFQRNVQAVKKAPNMVMDCETSFEASFAYSDAQISDHSSMMHQYLLMDKPLLWFMNLSSAMTNEEFIGCEWMEQAQRCDEIIAFLEHIRQGEDKKAHLRKKTVERDLPQADGRCGERVCETVWEAMHQEDCMSVLEPS